MFVDVSKINVEAVQRALALGCDVTFLATDLFRTMYADDTVISKLKGARIVHTAGHADGPDALQDVQRVHAERPLDGILTMLEQNVLGVARIARALGIRGTSLEGAARARNKLLTRLRLAEAGLASCRHVAIENAGSLRAAIAELGFPVIAKPVSGYGKFITRLLSDAEDLENFMAEMAQLREALHPIDRALISPEMIIEEVIAGRMYSVEIGIDDNGTYPFMVTERRRPDHNLVLELGSTMPAGAPELVRQVIAEYAERVVRALGLDIGVFHLEVIQADSGPVLVEANARLMGGTLPLLFTRSTGRVIYDDLIRIHTGQAVNWNAERKTRYATVRQVAPIVPGTALHDLDPESLRRDQAAVEWSSVKFRQGDFVQPMTCNTQSLGCFHVVSDSYVESLQRANEVLDHVEQKLGVEIAR